MNLFLLGWNLAKNLKSDSLIQFRRTCDVHPFLDPNTLWSIGEGNSVFAVSMHTAASVSAPRTYVDRRDDQVTSYGGCLVNPSGNFWPHEAGQVASNWAQIDNAQVNLVRPGPGTFTTP